MRPPASPALVDWTEEQLRDAARSLAVRVEPSYAAVMAELDRRAANRQARLSMVLSVVGLAIALVAVMITALKA
jgi:hypothetical protein